MFDPLSLALMAGGAAASGIGSFAKANAKSVNDSKFLAQNLQADQQQIQQDWEAAQLRNAILDQYRNTARGFATENQGNFNTGIAAFSPGAQTNALGSATDARTRAISGAIGEGPKTDIPFRAGAPDAVRAEYGSKLGDAFSRAQSQGGRMAQVGAYGDWSGANDRSIGNTGQQVQTVNTLAKGNAALLPAEQDLAAYKANKPIFRPAQPDQTNMWWADLLQGAGKLGGVAAGGGINFGGFGGAAPGVGSIPGVSGVPSVSGVPGASWLPSMTTKAWPSGKVAGMAYPGVGSYF